MDRYYYKTQIEINYFGQLNNMKIAADDWIEIDVASRQNRVDGDSNIWYEKPEWWAARQTKCM